MVSPVVSSMTGDSDSRPSCQRGMLVKEKKENVTEIATADPSIRWNTLNSLLMAKTVLAAPSTTPGTFFSHCQEVDHRPVNCALVSVDQFLKGHRPRLQTSLPKSSRLVFRSVSPLQLWHMPWGFALLVPPYLCSHRMCKLGHWAWSCSHGFDRHRPTCSYIVLWESVWTYWGIVGFEIVFFERLSDTCWTLCSLSVCLIFDLFNVVLLTIVYLYESQLCMGRKERKILSYLFSFSLHIIIILHNYK